MAFIFDIGTKQLLVRETRRDSETGDIVSRVIIHQPILGGLNADGPAAAKLSRFLTAGAFLACGHCVLRGSNTIHIGPPSSPGEPAPTKKGVMHYLGYSKPVTCGLMLNNAPTVQASCGDTAIAVTSDMQVSVLATPCNFLSHLTIFTNA